MRSRLWLCRPLFFCEFWDSSNSHCLLIRTAGWANEKETRCWNGNRCLLRSHYLSFRWKNMSETIPLHQSLQLRHDLVASIIGTSCADLRFQICITDGTVVQRDWTVAVSLQGNRSINWVVTAQVRSYSSMSVSSLLRRVELLRNRIPPHYVSGCRTATWHIVHFFLLKQSFDFSKSEQDDLLLQRCFSLPRCQSPKESNIEIHFLNASTADLAKTQSS